MRTAYDVIIRPIITEQSMEDLDIKKYVFEVAKDAGKIEIKKAIEELLRLTSSRLLKRCLKALR
jgi:large subunit ribosomal protein L23